MEVDNHAQSIPLPQSPPDDTLEVTQSTDVSLSPGQGSIPNGEHQQAGNGEVNLEGMDREDREGEAVDNMEEVSLEEPQPELAVNGNAVAGSAPAFHLQVNGDAQDDQEESRIPLPPTPPAKLPPLPDTASITESETPISPRLRDIPAHLDLNERRNSHSRTSTTLHAASPSSPSHRRTMTMSKGNTFSVVLISTALETIAASKEAKRSAPLRDSTQRALEMVRANQGGDRPREIFEPLRLACETRNEKLMIASLDCISKLISYSFFAEANPEAAQHMPSPPPSPHPSGRNSAASGSQASIAQPSLVDLVAHTITACHTETTPETVSLQIVKALLSLVLSSTILVHHSSLLKAVRTVYNVFLLSADPVNQMVAQGGLTQMVHHVFTRCKVNAGESTYMEQPSSVNPSGSHDSMPASRRSSTTFVNPQPEAHPSTPTANGHDEEHHESPLKSPSATSDNEASLPSPKSPQEPAGPTAHDSETQPQSPPSKITL